MTDANYTAIMLLVDRSGSMISIRDSAAEAVNGFLDQQRTATGRRTVRVAQFDTQYETVHKSLNAADIPKYELAPRYGTALHDAMGRSIDEFGAELALLKEEDRPSTVIYAVMTDGLENASTEYTREQIREMVRHQEDKYSWQILYLGANQDAIRVGHGLGVRMDRSISYSASDVGTRAVTNSLSGYVAAASAGTHATFSDEDREEAMKDDE
jgi:hypothetical protein